MKVLNTNIGLEIIESEGCKIVEKFIDFDSQLLVVGELNLNDEILYYYTINQQTKKIIDFIERLKYFNYDKELIKCKNSFWKIISKRNLIIESGKELVHEKLVDKNNSVLFSRTVIAFNKEKLCGLEDLYLNNIKVKEKEQLFWIEEYSNYSIERKVNYWLAYIHQGMRIQGEATSDPYTEFSIEWYKYVNSKESDFDSIFSEVVSRMGENFNWDEYLKRIGKMP